MNIWRSSLLLLMVIMLNACSSDTPPQVDGLRVGPWRAVLQVPGGELPFGMSVSTRDGKALVTLINGGSRVEIDEITVRDGEATLLMPGFENRIVARIDGDTLRGTLTMVKAGGVLQQIPFTARHGQTWRFTEPGNGAAASAAASATRMAQRAGGLTAARHRPSPILAGNRQHR